MGASQASFECNSLMIEDNIKHMSAKVYSIHKLEENPDNKSELTHNNNQRFAQTASTNEIKPEISNHHFKKIVYVKHADSNKDVNIITKIEPNGNNSLLLLNNNKNI